MSPAASMMTIRVIIFAADTDGGKSAIWNILTEYQKTQLVTDAKTKLAQGLGSR